MGSTDSHATSNLRHIVRELTGRGLRVEFSKENLTFAGDDSPMNTLLLLKLGAVAEFERSTILERRREGIALAKAAEKYKGRKASLSHTQASELRDAWPMANLLPHSPRNTV
jgi:DNA invertase Pin-like site-specific DNA recombinase